MGIAWAEGTSATACLFADIYNGRHGSIGKQMSVRRVFPANSMGMEAGGGGAGAAPQQAAPDPVRVEDFVAYTLDAKTNTITRGPRPRQYTQQQYFERYQNSPLTSPPMNGPLLAWSNDGTRIAVSIENTTTIYDTETWERVGGLATQQSRVAFIAWSPCDTWIAEVRNGVGGTVNRYLTLHITKEFGNQERKIFKTYRNQEQYKFQDHDRDEFMRDSSMIWYANTGEQSTKLAMFCRPYTDANNRWAAYENIVGTAPIDFRPFHPEDGIAVYRLPFGDASFCLMHFIRLQSSDMGYRHGRIAWAADGTKIACTGLSKQLKIFDIATSNVDFEVDLSQNRDQDISQTTPDTIDHELKLREGDLSHECIDLKVNGFIVEALYFQASFNGTRMYKCEFEYDTQRRTSFKGFEVSNLTTDFKCLWRGGYVVEPLLPRLFLEDEPTVEFAMPLQIFSPPNHLVAVRLGRRVWPHGVAMNPDGYTLAVATLDGMVEFWRRRYTSGPQYEEAIFLFLSTLGHTSKQGSNTNGNKKRTLPEIPIELAPTIWNYLKKSEWEILKAPFAGGQD